VFVRVRARSVTPFEGPANEQFLRTGAHRRERSPILAMQKVVGSSPIIRFYPCKSASAGVLFDNR
jgi:hypothetical protein